MSAPSDLDTAAAAAGLSAAEVEAAVKREGLTLVQSAVSTTGYQGACAHGRRFKARGNKRSLGTYASALEAALCVARFLGPDASAAAAAAGPSAAVTSGGPGGPAGVDDEWHGAWVVWAAWVASGGAGGMGGDRAKPPVASTQQHPV